MTIYSQTIITYDYSSAFTLTEEVAFQWPLSLPQCPIMNFQERPQPNVVSFKPDVGPPKQRRRSTAKGWLTSVTFRMTNAQLLIFKTFYEDELEDGSLPMFWAHPVTKVDYWWNFMAGDEPEISRFAPNASMVSFRLLRLPP